MSAHADRGHAPSEMRTRGMFFAVTWRYLDQLHHYVRHQLAYLASIGAIQPGELRAEEVVDGVLLRAQQEFVKASPKGKIRSWLINRAQEHLSAEVARSKSWRDRTQVRLERDIPDKPPAEWVSTLGDETVDFHEPDEDLKVEDVLPDLEVDTPEELTEGTELRWCVNAALAGMPRRWRQILVLRHVEGLAGEEIARTLGEPRPDVERTLDHARRYLRQRLIEAGCRFGARRRRNA